MAPTPARANPATPAYWNGLDRGTAAPVNTAGIPFPEPDACCAAGAGLALADDDAAPAADVVDDGALPPEAEDEAPGAPGIGRAMAAAR